MEEIDIKYKDIEFVSRKYAGREGFQFRHDGEIIITVFVSDLGLASAIDEALKKKYKTDE